MSKDFKYFRIKMSYQGTDATGAIVPIKTEDIVMAVCYSDAEAIAYKLAEGKNEYGEVDIEIVKTKISEIAYNDTFATDTELIGGLISYYLKNQKTLKLDYIKFLWFTSIWMKKRAKSKMKKVRFMCRHIHLLKQ